MGRIVSVSGGKDSTAMLLWVIEQGFEFEPLFCDTGWEASETYDYLEYLETTLGITITRISAPLQMVELVVQKGMFPSRRFRYCTQYLKVFPLLEYIGNRTVTNYVGIRAQESRARARLRQWGVMDGADNIYVHRPLLRWSVDDVVATHRRHGVKPNPLYLLGVERVGCWPCCFERKSDIRIIAKHDPERIDLVRALEAITQKRQSVRLAARGETYGSKGWHPPTWFSLKRGKGGDRKSTHIPIDDVIAWARTDYGGKQLMLDHGDGRRGCMRWGLCGS